MSWTNVFKLAAATLALGTASATLAGSIVIRASGPSAKAYPTGRAVPDGGRLTLKAGDTVVLLDTRGTRTLSGPGTYDIGGAARGTATASAFTALIGNTGTRQVRTGAVRGTTTGQPRVASLWHIDTSKSGTVCLKDTSRAMLWRASMAQPATFSLSRGTTSVPIVFAAGQSVKSWPVDALPLSVGSEYRISGPGLASPTTIRVAVLAAKGDAPDEVAGALIDKGCSAQLDVLVEAGKASAATG